MQVPFSLAHFTQLLPVEVGVGDGVAVAVAVGDGDGEAVAVGDGEGELVDMSTSHSFA